jgi:hypothetical protein
MSQDNRSEETKQFTQSATERNEKLRFDQTYKSIGISAVTAAAQFTTKSAKKTPQMS